MDTTNIFTVTPMSHDIKLTAGQEYIGELIVANPANASRDFSYKVEISPYAVIDDGYTVDFLTRSERTQITDWITIDKPKGTLKPNETATVNFTIKVPETAQPGGQYAMLLISSDNDASLSNGISVNNIFEMASIIYANVEGESIREGEVLENNIPGFVTTMPIKVATTLKNDGNAHEIAKISLEVNSFFSAAPIYPQPGESGTVNEVIMPGTSRYITRDITGMSPLGVYEVTQTINYIGENYQFKQTVVACPVWFMALAAVTIIAVIVATVHRIKSHRRKRRAL